MNHPIYKVCVCLYLYMLSLGHPVNGQSTYADHSLKAHIPYIDSAYHAFAKQHHSPGLAYAVVSQGKVIHSGTYGYANVEQDILVSEKTVFRIASMTKSFVAAAVLQLRDQGKLRLDDPVSAYLPSFSKQALPTTDAPNITIRHLLTHTSGLPEDDPWGDRLLDMSIDSFYQVLDAGLSFSNTPGVTYEYSNTPFALLGEVIRTVTGEHYEAYINAHILAPLGMEDTYWDYREVPSEYLANGYRWLDHKWERETLYGPGVYGAMGGMLTTLGDFAKYLSLHQQAWPARDGSDEQPLNRSSLREMQSPMVFNTLVEYSNVMTSFAYGYGLRWTRDVNGVTTVGHTGGLPGFGSNWLFLPDYGLGLICFSNVTYAPAPAINTEVALELIKRIGLQPHRPQASAILQQRQQELMAFLPDWVGATEYTTTFSSNFFPDYPLRELQTTSKRTFEKAGKIRNIGEIKQENNLRGTFIVECEHQNIEIFISLTPESSPRIQQFSIRLVDK